uniref:hypothetical protein n=1 Tax=Pseudonocardia sp. CA-138482 TaxID=3240023 RepID=UPI003F49073F
MAVPALDEWPQDLAGRLDALAQILGSGQIPADSVPTLTEEWAKLGQWLMDKREITSAGVDKGGAFLIELEAEVLVSKLEQTTQRLLAGSQQDS